MILSYLIFFIFTLKASSGIAVEGPCPVVKAVENYNLSAFAEHTWYEIARYPNDWENLEDCSKVTFTKDDEGYKINVTEVFEKEGAIKYLEGYLEDDEAAAHSGIINWKSKVFQASEGVVTLKAYVMDVDYDSYQINYVCQYDELNKVRHDYVWILSRTKQLEGNAKAAIDNYIESSNIIFKDKLIFNEYKQRLCKAL